MFAKYNLKLRADDLKYNGEFYETGNKIFNAHKTIVAEDLKPYISPDGSLDASAIEDDWFPGIVADVFISHSHKDECAVIRLAGFLQKSYGITSFIDSTVWGYANDLLKEIDDKYCVQSIKPSGGHTYDYDHRNQSTAHVHMILQGALAKMINKAECLIFVNTPNSLTVRNIGEGDMTSSPWIYSELLMADTFPARKAEEYRIAKAERDDSIFEHSALDVKYKVNLKGFMDLDLNDIQTAGSKVKSRTARNVLNQLYLDTGLIEKNYIRG